jgi:hypothetical protein
MDSDSQAKYLESVVEEVEKSEEQLNRLLVEAKMRRNHNLGRLREVYAMGERLKWRDDRGTLQKVRTAINEL